MVKQIMNLYENFAVSIIQARRCSNIENVWKIQEANEEEVLYTSTFKETRMRLSAIKRMFGEHVTSSG